MSKKPIVLTAFSAALASTSPVTAKAPEALVPSAYELAPAVSPAARNALMERIRPAGTAETREQMAAGKFKLFDNGPTFVKAIKPPTRAR